MTVAANPAAGKNVRPAQSYLALVAGNWAFSADYVAQWWGPGVDSALHRSTNAKYHINRASRSSLAGLARWPEFSKFAEKNGA